MDAAWSMILIGWMTGRLAGDRTIPLQWLSWMPTLAVLAAGLVWVGGRSALRGGAGWRRGLGVLGVVMVAAATLRGEVRVWSIEPAASPQDVRVAQWNTDALSGSDPRSEAVVVGLGADILLFSNRGSITSEDRVRAWAGADFTVAGAGIFACVTRFPIDEARVIAVDGKGHDLLWVAKFVVRPPAWQGRPLRIAMIDMPSRPTLSRESLARQLEHLLEHGELGEVDIVAGDFNALPGSEIIRQVFSAMHDAWEESGSGVRASWPRRLPLWSIDHVLLAPDIRATRCVTVDPGTSMHRLNLVSLRPR
jgi:hypothetical protein